MRRYTRRAGALLAALVCVAWSAAPASAQSDAASDESARPYSSVVVQNRLFDPTHELSIAVGALPLDAFTKGVTLSGSYTLHFSSFFAWEVGQFVYSFQYDTPLRDELDATLGLQPLPFELLDFYASTNAVFKPLYWKGAWMNSALAHGELLLNAGFAYGWFTRSQRPGLDLGAAVRLFATENLSFRLNTRYLLFVGGESLETIDVKDELWISLGTSLSF